MGKYLGFSREQGRRKEGGRYRTRILPPPYGSGKGGGGVKPNDILGGGVKITEQKGALTNNTSPPLDFFFVRPCKGGGGIRIYK